MSLALIAAKKSIRPTWSLRLLGVSRQIASGAIALKAQDGSKVEVGRGWVGGGYVLRVLL